METRKRTLPPGARIRVLAVDDSVVIRRLLTRALEEDPAIEVLGAVSNGRTALERIPQLRPDVLTLDIEMPEMDGLETLRHIRQLYPHLYVIMFSTLTERGAAATMDALSLGANDYVAKASNAGSLDRSLASLQSELIPKIKQFFRSAPVETFGKPAAAASGRNVSPFGGAVPRRVLAIGTSTGGPNALAKVIPLLPKDFPLPVVMVQHMPPVFTRLLAERLNAQSPLQVEEAAEGSVVEPGKVLIAAGDFHLKLARSGLKTVATLDRDAPENSCRPAVDVLFRSVAQVYGGSAIACVLTGMGQDGLAGAQVLRGKGAYVIAQDEASSIVWGMPGAVAKAGLASATVGLDDIVPEILRQL